MLRKMRNSRIGNAAAVVVVFGVLAGCAQMGGGSSGKAGTADVARADQKMMKDIAESNIAEIQTAKMALSKSQDVHVRAYAQKMIDDHTNAMQALQLLAQSKRIELPKETDLQHKAMATGLNALSGEAFDRRYMQHAGVGDHQRTAELLQKVLQTSTDADLRAHAKQMLPIVQQHLDIAQQLTPAMGGTK